MGTSRTTTADTGRPAGADDERAPMPGDVIGKYRIVDRIGTGAMGRVYSADHESGARVALKVLRARYAFDGDVVSRFVLEAEALAQLSHPNIVKVSEIVDAPPWPPAFAMELLQGRTAMEELAETGAFPVARACRVASAVAAALESVHAKALVHRDVKPDNVFLHHAADGSEHVKLLDFGVAKALDQRERRHETALGRQMGTIEYMAPEQFLGSASVDARADVYALGVMAYELLTARLPFVGENSVQVLRAIMSAAPPAPSSVRAAGLEKVPPQLDALVLACLNRDAAGRPSSMRSVSERFAAFT